MLKLFKLLLFILVIGFLGLVGFAYLGDLSPTKTERTLPVTLDAQ